MKQAPTPKLPIGRQLQIALVVLAVGGLVLLAHVLWSGYREVWHEAQASARSHAELIEARLDATLRRLDAELLELSGRIPREALRQESVPQFRERIERDLAGHQQAFPEVAGFRVIDADGNVLYISGGGNYVNLADRTYFSRPRDGDDSGIIFSEVLTSRITGRTSMVAARAIRSPDGRFLGLISSAIELDYFSGLFRSVHIGKAGVLAIRRSDTHALVVRHPAIPAEINRPLEVANPIRPAIEGGGRNGIMELVAQSDGQRRLYAYSVLTQYPFFVVAGLSEADVMAAWRQRSLILGLLGLAWFCSLGLVMRGLFRAQQRELAAVDNLRRHEEQLNAAQRIAQLGSWEIDPETWRVDCSEELHRIFEIGGNGEALYYEDLLAIVHPDDRQEVDAAIQCCLRERRPVSLKHRLWLPDGRLKHVLECCEADCGANGKVLRVIGTAQDVTSQYQLEAEMQLLVSAFEFSGEAILISDADNHIVTVNPAFTRLTGYTAEEARGRNPGFLSAGRTTPEEYERMWRAINERGFWQGEIWDRRKDGGVYPKWMSVSVIRDETGQVRYYVAHFTDVSGEREVEAQLHHMAHHDVLTGLLNRFSLKSRLDQALAAARREGGQVALLFIDLDRFKVINDTLGHHIGDQLLIEIARRLQGSVRDSDVVARLGGDEFVIMLAGIEHTSSVAMVAEKLVLAISEACTIDGHNLYTTPSIGIALFPTDGPDGETLMKNADSAMYHAKTAGRNNFQFFDARMNSTALERLKIEHSLRQALSRDEFRLHFQPVIEAGSGRVAGVEALIRWQHPEHGLLLPGRFIGIAEETGLILPLGDWVFWAACRQLADFRAHGLKGLRMGVNISALQLRNGNLPLLVRGAIEAFALDPAELLFEITESVAMEQPAETVRILDLLHDMGVGLAIDDFGTGYSSLSYLRLFPIDLLKLDRSFVGEIGQVDDGKVICDATIDLAHNLGLRIVAEGVETAEQAEYLHGRGCDLMQGFLYSRALPADEILAFIKARNA